MQEGGNRRNGRGEGKGEGIRGKNKVIEKWKRSGGKRKGKEMGRKREGGEKE